MQVMNGIAATGVPRCLYPRAVAGVPAAAALAHTTPPGGAVAAELAGVGTFRLTCGPGAGACFLVPGRAVV
jgi:hypothetical protein